MGDYLKSYTGAYSTLTYLKGDDMLDALRESHNNARKAMDEQVDGVDKLLNDIQPYTTYGHQKDDAPSAPVQVYENHEYENPEAAEARKRAIEAKLKAKEKAIEAKKAKNEAEAAELHA